MLFFARLALSAKLLSLQRAAESLVPSLAELFVAQRTAGPLTFTQAFQLLLTQGALKQPAPTAGHSKPRRALSFT